MDAITSVPKLIENGAHVTMSNLLHKCHDNRVNIYLYTLNIGILLLFILITGFTLYYCHKTKTTPEENRQKMFRRQPISTLQFTHQLSV
jgi:hypothetical protein